MKFPLQYGMRPPVFHDGPERPLRAEAARMPAERTGHPSRARIDVQAGESAAALSPQ